MAAALTTFLYLPVTENIAIWIPFFMFVLSSFCCSVYSTADCIHRCKIEFTRQIMDSYCDYNCTHHTSPEQTMTYTIKQAGKTHNGNEGRAEHLVPKYIHIHRKVYFYNFKSRTGGKNQSMTPSPTHIHKITYALITRNISEIATSHL
jgi:hypothetical protein